MAFRGLVLSKQSEIEARNWSQDRPRENCGYYPQLASSRPILGQLRASGESPGLLNQFRSGVDEKNQVWSGFENTLKSEWSQNEHRGFPPETEEITSSQQVQNLAKQYKASIASRDAVYQWKGDFPKRSYQNEIYSCKVFVGGIPWDMNEADLAQFFGVFGRLEVDWPGKCQRSADSNDAGRNRGYAYLIFESDNSVKQLLDQCSRESEVNTSYYYKMSVYREGAHDYRKVQIVPWILSDSSFVLCNIQRMDPNKTIFVGALHGQTALHLLGTTGKENAAAIFDLFLKNIPNCPVDKPDAEGNSLLMLAYMNGNVQLCKACVRSNCVIGHTNIHGISIFNFEVATKQLLYKLLEQISKEPKWSEGEHCSECGLKFNLTNRRHHCRHCGRLLCSKDSENLMPILKYDLQKPVRVCNVCYEVLTKGSNPFD